jgi:prepilin-type N-terminal cleavage/methylation domain-containing protein
MLKNCRKNYKGFTLLELLVVVLIIGILAAIALPQYRLAVGKSKYATLKSITKSLKDSMNRYYLVNNRYPTKFADLDIGLDITSEETFDYAFTIYKKDFACELWNSGLVLCRDEIAGTTVRYLNFLSTRLCDVYSVNVNDIPNRICQAETGKSANQAECTNTICRYYY